MNPQEKMIYEYDSFQVDPDSRVLLENGNRVSLTPREFSVLLVLVENSGQVVKKDDLMSEVWKDAFVDENNLSVQIRSLRRKIPKNEVYIETVPGVGYKFTANVRESTYTPIERKFPRKRTLKFGVVILAILVVVFLGSYGFRRYQESRVRSVMDEAGLREFSFYKNPKLFTKDHLRDYWILPEQGGTAAQKIEEAVQRLIRDERVYGQETKRELFEVQRVSVSVLGNKAEVVIREVWYMPNYDKAGRHLPMRSRQEFADEKYTLHKLSGRWLIFSTSAHYKN